MLKSRRQRGKKARALRIFFATDVHGSEVCFRKFLAAAKVYQADLLILGGDFAGKALVPVLTQDGELHARVGGERASVPAAEWDRLAADVSRAGFSPVRVEAEELTAPENDPGAPRRQFPRSSARQHRRWGDVADSSAHA